MYESDATLQEMIHSLEVEEVLRDGSVQLDPIFRQDYRGITIQMTTGIDCDSELFMRMSDLFAELEASMVPFKILSAYRTRKRAREEFLQIFRDVM